MHWGLTSGGWMQGLVPAHAKDDYRAQLEMLASYGLHATGWSGQRLLRMEQGRLEELAGWLEEFDVRVVLGVGFRRIDNSNIGRGGFDRSPRNVNPIVSARLPAQPGADRREIAEKHSKKIRGLVGYSMHRTLGAYQYADGTWMEN